MDPKHFEIKEYMIIWRQLEIQNFNGITAKVRAIVRCTIADLHSVLRTRSAQL